MQVSESKILEWKSLKERKDMGVLAKELNVSNQCVYGILKTGKGQIDHISKITSFYEKRAIKVKKLK